MTGFPVPNDKDKETKEDPNDIDASFWALVKETEALEATMYPGMTFEEIMNSNDAGVFI